MDDALLAMAEAPVAEARADGAAPRAGEPLAMSRVLATDAAPDTDLLGRAAHAGLLAELALHRSAETPFCIGILGPAGVGKSAFAAQVAGGVEALAARSAEAGLASAFVQDVVVVRPDPGAPGSPETLLADAVLATLRRTHPALAEELDHAGADPREVVRATAERHDGLRRQLDGERQALDALRGREALLFEAATGAAGTTLDLYARAHRARIEGALRPFGFEGRDPVATFKALVREAAEGAGSRLTLALRAFYAFPGQTRLLVGALALAAVAWGCAALRDDAAWIEALRGTHEKAGPVADWLGAHLPWLGTLETAALVAAFALLLVNVLRAGRFMLPLSRGIDLLQGDVEARRRDLAGALAHQTRRTDALAADAEAASATLAEAERRAASAGGRARATASPPAALFAALADALGRGPDAPERVLVVLDGLDDDPERGVALLEAVRRLAGRGLVTVAAGDADRLAAGFADGGIPTGALARCIQVPFRLGTDGETAGRGFALALMGRGKAPPTPARPDSRRSSLDLDWTVRETETVAALAPLAGDSPREVKRLVNLYRIARADPRLVGAPRPVLAALALALALDIRGRPEDLEALGQGRGGEAGADALQAGLAAARNASGEAIDAAAARRAFTVAATYSVRHGRPHEAAVPGG